MAENITITDIDSISRNKIVSETNKNFFVEAGAGSGKTTMLVSRMVAMVEAGIDISKICAITFTKAAAGEFYNRFQKALIERSNPDYVWADKGFAGQLPAPTDTSRERCTEALKNIDLCFMGTIDSFCGMVLSEHPSEAGIPSDATILSDDEAKSIYKQIFVGICEGKYGEKLRELSSAFRTLHYDPSEVFVRGQKMFMDNRNVYFNYNPADEKLIDVDKVFLEDKENIVRALSCLSEHRELMYSNTNASVSAWDELDKSLKRLKGKWSYNMPRVLFALKAIKDIRVIPSALDKYAISLGPCFAPGGARGVWLEFTPTQDGGLYDKLNDLRYRISMTFLNECVPVIEQVMRDKGAMTFFDYLYYLRNMLKKDATEEGKLIRYIYDRHSYFLIDEFQDTNPMQAEIFFYLASEKPVGQWSSCVPRPGSLFIVGDPKQSIYRFRGADVSSFLKVKRLFEVSGGEILSLSRNFRSTRGLHLYFNDVFSKMLPEETVDQSKYEPIPPADKDRDEFQGIYSYAAYSSSLAADHPGESDPEQIRKIINALVGHKEFLITVGDEEPRPITYNDIMIIVYGKAKIDGIMQELEQNEIPMRVEGKVPFKRNDALILVAKIYTAIARPEDRMSLYEVLKGTYYGISDEELMKYRLAGGTISLLADVITSEDEPVARIGTAISKLKEILHRSRGMSPVALFTEIMDGLEVFRVTPAENLEVLYYTLELMRNAEKTGKIVSLSDGSAYLSELITEKSGEERCLSLSEDGNRVHIANLHKVKGLEAPIVILSSAPQFGGSSDYRIVHGDNASEGYIFALKKERDDSQNNSALFETKDYGDEKAAEQASGSAENTRLVYVAATRARNALIVCDSIQKNRSGETHKSIWTNFIPGAKDIFKATEEATAAVREKPELVSVSPLYDQARADCVLNNRDAQKATHILENPSKTRISSKLNDEVENVVVVDDSTLAEGYDVENSDKDIPDKESTECKTLTESARREIAEVHRYPTLLGTMTHRLMEILISTRNEIDSKLLIDEIIREYRTPQNAPHEKQLSEALSGVAKAIRSGGYSQTNTAPKDILRTLLDADEVYCEVPFCYKENIDGEDVLWNGIMDVVYCSAGVWHIIDYKTNADGNDLDKKYQAQLNAYIKAFKATTGHDADAMTYHIDI